MGSMMVVTIFFPSIIVNLLITIDTVFSSADCKIKRDK